MFTGSDGCVLHLVQRNGEVLSMTNGCHGKSFLGFDLCLFKNWVGKGDQFCFSAGTFADLAGDHNHMMPLVFKRFSYKDEKRHFHLKMI